MTPEAAAEGRRLLHRQIYAEQNLPGTTRNGSDLEKWLWANREALVRCAELVAERATPTETAHCDGCGTSVERCNAFPPPAIKCCPDCKHVPDPSLAHALANPPGPRHAVYDCKGEGHAGCGVCWVCRHPAAASARETGRVLDEYSEAKGAPPKPEGET